MDRLADANAGAAAGTSQSWVLGNSAQREEIVLPAMAAGGVGALCDWQAIMQRQPKPTLAGRLFYCTSVMARLGSERCPS
jgi:hypothetical protein